MRNTLRLGMLAACAASIVITPAAAGASAPPALPVPVSVPGTGGPVLNPVVEAQNYSKTLERQAIYMTPQYQLALRTVGAENLANATREEIADPGREFSSDLCWNEMDGCAGDVRLYDWQSKGYGVVQPVLFTARDGATISGHIWATRSGPARRPGIVITNGSVQADEQMYWYAAQALAKDGYVVMTFDPQGQGQSDTFGQAPDQSEGFPAQTDGRPFFDGTEDALNFFFSTPSHPYVPESSCSTGTSHAAKQAQRVQAGLDSAYNPYWQLFNGAVGLAGHSYGAAGISYIGQWDPRVKAIVAWDNLSQPAPGTGGTESFPPGEDGCPAHPQDRSAVTKLHAPALGMSADYFLPPTPNTTYPDQSGCPAVEAAYENGQEPTEQQGLNCKSLASDGYSKHGIDSGEIVIRGGSHLDFSFIPNQAFGATLRGADMITWYTTAWFDRYLKHDSAADARLLTNRWRHDGEEASVDPTHDGNMFSFYHPSRLDISLSGGRRVDCENLRDGCSALTDNDRYTGEYSYLTIDTSPDGSGPAKVRRGTGIYGSAATAPVPATCAASRTVHVRLGVPRGARVTKVVARVGQRVVGGGPRARLTLHRARLRKRAVTVSFSITMRVNGKTLHLKLTHRYRACGARGG
jgi:dienelactone hydrolase